MAAKKTTKTPANKAGNLTSIPMEAPDNSVSGDATATRGFDASAVMAQLQALTERVATAESENRRLEAALAEAKETGSFTDEMGNKVSILTGAMANVNAQIHDKPGTLIEKLDIMERQAKIRREPFDRERTRKILCGEEVEDLNHFICDRCGRAETKWNDHPELFDAHVQQHITGKARAYGARRKIRPVDEEDDEATERAVLARLSEKYGVVAAS